MNQTAEVIQIPQENQFKIVKFELTPRAITEMVKEYNSLEIIPGDKESYSTVHKAKMVLVKARTGTDKRRKELGSDARQWISDVNTTAQELIAPLLPLEEKLKAMLDEEDSREAKIEQARLAKIDKAMEDLTVTIASGLQYNLSADSIFEVLNSLNTYPISSVDFEERTEEAEQLLEKGLGDVSTAYFARTKFEEDQAEAARVKAEQKAEAKKLAEERAAFEEAQAKTNAENKAREEAAAKLAAQEAEKNRIAAEKLEADRLTLKKEKAEIAAAKQAEDDAVKLKALIEKIHTEALLENAELDRVKRVRLAAEEKARKEKLKADKARAKLITADKKTVQATINQIDKMISEIKPFDYKTNEAAQVIADLYVRIKIALDDAEKAGCELV